MRKPGFESCLRLVSTVVSWALGTWYFFTLSGFGINVYTSVCESIVLCNLCASGLNNENSPSATS